MIFAIYSRKSRFSESGDSIENQVQMCKEFIDKNFSNIEGIKVYEDEGFSGKDTNRPEFQKAIKDARKKKFNVLICYRLDRISRNVADFSNTIEELQKNSIDFVSIKEQFDTSTPMGRAMMNIAAVFAQLERETIAERIKDNMIELSKTGRWLGGTSPLGYESQPVEFFNEHDKSKKMFKLSIVEEEIAIVKLIYRLFLEKQGFASVATYLCKNHYTGKNGGEFSRGTVEQIINNPVYCISDENIMKWFEKKGSTVFGTPDGIHGLMVYNKRKENGKKEKPISEWIVAVGQHNGIVSSSDWIKCQKIIQENKSKVSPRSGTGKKFLLSGLIVCGECASGMASWSHYNKKSDFMERYYRCNLRNRASNRCNNKMLNAYKVEEYVEKYLKEVSLEKLLSLYKRDTSKKEKCIIENALGNLKQQREENGKMIKGLVRKMALLNDDIEIIGLLKFEIQNIQNENNDVIKKIEELESKYERVLDDEDLVSDIENKLLNFKKYYDFVDTVNKRILVKSLIESIVWYSDKDFMEINLIGSNKSLPQGKVKRRNS